MLNHAGSMSLWVSDRAAKLLAYHCFPTICRFVTLQTIPTTLDRKILLLTLTMKTYFSAWATLTIKTERVKAILSTCCFCCCIEKKKQNDTVFLIIIFSKIIGIVIFYHSVLPWWLIHFYMTAKAQLSKSSHRGVFVHKLFKPAK